MASILVIDDVAAVRMAITIALEGAGHRVTGAADGNAGLAALKIGSFDLVIADIWMPGASGATVIRQGRDRSPRTRFLAITGGHPSRRAQQNALRLEDFGADEVLEKPFEKAKLLDAVARLLGQ